jgi:hypothetical protein
LGARDVLDRQDLMADVRGRTGGAQQCQVPHTTPPSPYGDHVIPRRSGDFLSRTSKNKIRF